MSYNYYTNSFSARQSPSYFDGYNTAGYVDTRSVSGGRVASPNRGLGRYASPTTYRARSPTRREVYGDDMYSRFSAYDRQVNSLRRTPEGYRLPTPTRYGVPATSSSSNAYSAYAQDVPYIGEPLLANPYYEPYSNMRAVGTTLSRRPNTQFINSRGTNNPLGINSPTLTGVSTSVGRYNPNRSNGGSSYDNRV